MVSLAEIKEPFYGLKNYNAENLFIATNWFKKRKYCVISVILVEIH